MKAAIWIGLLVIGWNLPTSAVAQTPPSDARVTDAWMLHLEDQLDSRVSAVSYFGAPLAIVEGLAFGLEHRL